jgi:hypothetical protein
MSLALALDPASELRRLGPLSRNPRVAKAPLEGAQLAVSLLPSHPDRRVRQHELETERPKRPRALPAKASEPIQVALMGDPTPEAPIFGEPPQHAGMAEPSLEGTEIREALAPDGVEVLLVAAKALVGVPATVLATTHPAPSLT